MTDTTVVVIESKDPQSVVVQESTGDISVIEIHEKDTIEVIDSFGFVSLNAKISTDNGNALSYGTDGGLVFKPRDSLNPNGYILKIDISRPIAYIGYESQIMKMDYATYPPVKTYFSTTNLENDWTNRANLGYA